MNISPITTNQNYKQQNFGALKIKVEDFMPLQYDEKFEQLLTKYGLVSDGVCAGVDDKGNWVTIILSEEGSKAQDAIMQFIGKAAEAIGIKDARKYIQNHSEALAEVDIGSTLS